MNTFIIIAAIISAAIATYAILLYLGKIKDTDGDFIPDVIEDKVEDIKADIKEVKAKVKRRVKSVKKELNDVAAAGRNVVKQSKDVVDAVKGKPRRGRKPSNKNRKTSAKK